jgi:glycoprotein endo-alpha-1,2-mannosidase
MKTMTRTSTLSPRACLAILLLASAILSPRAAAAIPTAPQRHDLVGAYYYPWYFPGKWKDLASQLTPTLGWYQTDSMPIVIQHIDTAAYYGIDVFYMSWWKKTDVTDAHLKNGFMKAPNKKKMKFAMVVEPLGELDTLDGKRDGIVDFSAPAVVAGWVEMFTYFKDNFWSDPCYLKVDGKPVVLVYVTRTFKNFGSQHLDSLRAHVGPTYIMADEAFIGTQSDPLTARNGIRNRFSVFDSYVSYNSYEAVLIQPGDDALAYQRRVGMPYYQKWASQTVFHPPIMPFYQDFREGHPPLPGSDAQFKTVIEEIKTLPVWAPAGDSVNRIFMVTSWNEWFEGTSLEPSVEHGSKPLQVLREAFVNQGAWSRPEQVVQGAQTSVHLKSATRNAYLCLERGGQGNLSARAACEPAAQGLILIDLGNNEMAIKDPVSGKYLGVHSDGQLYPIDAYIGTWEIFRVQRQGESIALQSKKTGAFLKPGTDAAAVVSAKGGLDADAWFSVESFTAGLPRGTDAASGRLGQGVSVSLSGGTLRVFAPGPERMRVSLADAHGRVLADRIFTGGGAYDLGVKPGAGIGFITVETRGFVLRQRLADVAP